MDEKSPIFHPLHKNYVVLIFDKNATMVYKFPNLYDKNDKTCYT